MEPTRTTVKRLFALSRNRCAFPQCGASVVEDEGTITGIICHIRARKPGGPRYDKKQTDDERHAFANLILMCSRHSKVIDSDPRKYTVGILESFKVAHEQSAENELSVSDGRKVDKLLLEYREIYINASKVVFTKAKGPTIAAPEGSIGSDLVRRNYAAHLIDRYNEFASKQPGRTKFSFAAIHSLLKKRYGVKKWELVPLVRFEDFCVVLQDRINKTWLGRINASKATPNFSTFEEYRAKYATG